MQPRHKIPLCWKINQQILPNSRWPHKITQQTPATYFTAYIQLPPINHPNTSWLVGPESLWLNNSITMLDKQPLFKQLKPLHLSSSNQIHQLQIVAVLAQMGDQIRLPRFMTLEATNHATSCQSLPPIIKPMVAWEISTDADHKLICQLIWNPQTPKPNHKAWFTAINYPVLIQLEDPKLTTTFDCSHSTAVHNDTDQSNP